jgi:hypothetical protein
MPVLAGYENVRNFIACVAHGMLIGVFDESDGTKLLYAAQVALTIANQERKTRDTGSEDPSPSSKPGTPHPTPSNPPDSQQGVASKG